MNTDIEQWFPIEEQRNYVSKLTNPKRIGLTRRRAEYFVRLWAYLLLKQQQELGKHLIKPLTQLKTPDGFVPCTHREAAELFYGNQDRGSDRAAGMMIDQLVALGLIEKQFDGNTICLRIQLPLDPKPPQTLQLKPDGFNPRTDAIPVATFLARNYNWMNKKTTAIPQRIAMLLRRWAEQYPTGMRVLRRCDNLHPVGFYVLYPTATESEKSFFLPSSQSLHLSSARETDPIAMAIPGDPTCISIFVRSWRIDAPYMQRSHVCQFLEDVQTTLIRMQADFPNICDMYTLIIHPSDEELASALRFQKTSQDRQLSVYWMYAAIDQYLTLDIPQALSGLEFSSQE